MAVLVANTHVPGHGWWGPAHGRVEPPAEVAALISNPACWDEAPTVEPVPAAVVLHGDGSVSRYGGAEDLSGSEGPASPMVSTGAAGSGDDGGDTRSPLEPDPHPSLDDLDKRALLALADERGVAVDKRWGERRLRDALRDAEEG